MKTSTISPRMSRSSLRTYSSSSTSRRPTRPSSKSSSRVASKMLHQTIRLLRIRSWLTRRILHQMRPRPRRKVPRPANLGNSSSRKWVRCPTILDSMRAMDMVICLMISQAPMTSNPPLSGSQRLQICRGMKIWIIKVRLLRTIIIIGSRCSRRNHFRIIRCPSKQTTSTHSP